MKISVKKGMVLFENETGMDLFWLGVISSKNHCNTFWEDGVFKGLEMTKKDLVIALGCKRD